MSIAETADDPLVLDQCLQWLGKETETPMRQQDWNQISGVQAFSSCP